jgi:hypothetical protein
MKRINAATQRKAIFDAMSIRVIGERRFNDRLFDMPQDCRHKYMKMMDEPHGLAYALSILESKMLNSVHRNWIEGQIRTLTQTMEEIYSIPETHMPEHVFEELAALQKMIDKPTNRTMEIVKIGQEKSEAWRNSTERRRLMETVHLGNEKQT